jgi:hypothetical protein
MAPPIASETTRSRLVAASAFAVLSILAPEARGQAPGDGEKRAQELFDEARALMRDGRYSEACPKLEESQELDPGGGTLLNLGICHEKEGRTATAFRELTDALALAGRDHRADRENTASKHLNELEPQLSRLTVQISSDVACTEVVVKVDDTVLPLDDIGRPVPLDPGKHRLTVDASGCQPWSKEIELGPMADQREVSVALFLNTPPPVAAGKVAPTPGATSVTPPPPAQTRNAPVARDSGSSMRVAGYAVGAAGIAALGVGAYFGVSALVLKNRSDSACPGGEQCTTQGGVTDFDDAKTHAHIADAALGAGLIALGVGTYLVIRAGSKEKPAQTVGLSIGGVRSGGIASCTGTF